MQQKTYLNRIIYTLHAYKERKLYTPHIRNIWEIYTIYNKPQLFSSIDTLQVAQHHIIYIERTLSNTNTGNFPSINILAYSTLSGSNGQSCYTHTHNYCNYYRIYISVHFVLVERRYIWLNTIAIYILNPKKRKWSFISVGTDMNSISHEFKKINIYFSFLTIPNPWAS